MAKLRKPPPFTVNHELKLISGGIAAGEVSSRCRREKGKKPRMMLKLQMCDRAAVETVAKSWGTALLTENPHSCPPTPNNPQGKVYSTEATSTRANLIIQAYKQTPLTNTQFIKKYQQKKANCK